MTQLASYFKGVSAKLLSAVEVQRSSSNQHELNGTVAMKGYFGDEKKQFSAQFIYIGSHDNDRLTLNASVTWYDARAANPARTEYRLYFSDNNVMSQAAVGDILITALDKGGNLLMLVVEAMNPLLGAILWWFGLTEKFGDSFVTIDVEASTVTSNALFRYIADEVGFEINDEPEKNWEDWENKLVNKFGLQFPTTMEFSVFAQETLAGEIDPIEAPDEALISLIDREEMLFRTLERKLVGDDLKAKADILIENVDAFISFSLSVQNRRKSRAGHALENHLEHIFKKSRVKYSRGKITEGRSKPDFIFPGQQKYLNADTPDELLTMLGVKTSCKDRWRQVLNEAQRIRQKHLLTLQPSISEHQTTEMRDADLTLVLPKPLHNTYSAAQQSYLLSLSDFMSVVMELEG